mgnify:CR=1 FL=1
MNYGKQFLLISILMWIAFSASAQTIEILDIYSDYKNNEVRVEISTQDVSDTIIAQLRGTKNLKWINPYIVDRDGCVFNFKVNKLCGLGENELKLRIKSGKIRKNLNFIYTPPNRLFVLSVGTGDNQCMLSTDYENLKYSTSGAKDVYDKVVDVGKAYEIQENILINDDSATSSVLAETIGRIIREVKEDDLVVMYFSGHGDTQPTDNKFKFQVKQQSGESAFCDGDWVSNDLWIGIREIANKGAYVWLFMNACYAHCLENDFPNNNTTTGLDGGVIIIPGDREKDSKAIEKPGRGSLFSMVLCKALADKKMIRDGKQTLGEITHYMDTSYNRLFGGDLFPIITHGNISRNEQYLYYDNKPIKKPITHLDFAIGWNLSRQWNPQIGFSWPNWSVFADCSVNCHWTDSITHKMGKKEFVDKLPSEKILAIGFGARFYPPFLNSVLSIKGRFNGDLGLGLSVQFGGIYGEKTISEIETIKHWKNYFSLTPTASLRFYSSKNRKIKLYFNVGYSFCFPYNINKEMRQKPFVTNVGVSIPVCSKNQKK